MGVADDWPSRTAEILDSGIVPPPPAGPLEPGVRYPLAVDVHDGVGAITFAVLDLHPSIAKGMWCEAVVYTRGRTEWVESLIEDNTTSPHPFQRPLLDENDTDAWTHWHSNGGLAQGGMHQYLTSFFGIAPVTTVRLTVTPKGGEERELRITPYSGAYVAAVTAPAWTLIGYGADGVRLGEYTVDHQEVES